MGEYTRALGEHIKSAISDRPNQVIGTISGVSFSSPPVYTVVATHPGKSEEIALQLSAPVEGNGVKSGELAIGTTVILDVPQGQLAFSRIVAIAQQPSDVEYHTDQTKDTNASLAQLSRPGGSWFDLGGASRYSSSLSRLTEPPK